MKRRQRKRQGQKNHTNSVEREEKSICLSCKHGRMNWQVVRGYNDKIYTVQNFHVKRPGTAIHSCSQSGVDQVKRTRL